MLEPSPKIGSHLNNFDVTGYINVTLVSDVYSAVLEILQNTYPSIDQEAEQLRQAYQDFEKLFTGQFSGYHSCDTLYHDMQHTLDMSLATARLLSAYETKHTNQAQGKRRFIFSMIVALFHDAGYIRQTSNDDAINGAAYTLSHVSRSGRFLKQYLPTLGMADLAELAAKLVHFTGYEVPISEIDVATERDRQLGQLIGTADLLAQLSDRCYLEKCRDRLYPEFVLGGLAKPGAKGADSAVYTSAENLLERTPMFFQASVLVRLEESFNKTYELERIFFHGNTPYMNAIHKNIAYLEKLIEKGNFDELRREPPRTPGEEQFPYRALSESEAQ